MELKELIKRAKEVKEKYRKINQKPWGVAEYAQGLVGDVGNLVKLVMVKDGFREIEDVDKKLVHELSDCLWSILVIADELGIDLEHQFIYQMDKLEERIDRGGK
ncbi:MAG: MazG nucleotide pyrophosphohydrolase domain-containing protein [Patescibacteria group bacterium]